MVALLSQEAKLAMHVGRTAGSTILKIDLRSCGSKC
jgi:hypothetical protein